MLYLVSFLTASSQIIDVFKEQQTRWTPQLNVYSADEADVILFPPAQPRKSTSAPETS
jgi:hypothetical protein